MQPYDRERFAAAIDGLPEKGQGPAMLQPALHGLRKTLAGLSGKTAVIMFTVSTTAYERLVPTTEVVGFEANDMLFDFGSTAI